MAEYRIEKDSMGEMRVPADALYGAQTQRAVENFPISGVRFPRVFLRALGLVKCLGIPWQGAGRCGAVGCGRSGALPQSNARSPWGIARALTTCASEAKRCGARALRSSSHKTLASKKSVGKIRPKSQ